MTPEDLPAAPAPDPEVRDFELLFEILVVQGDVPLAVHQRHRDIPVSANINDLRRIAGEGHALQELQPGAPRNGIGCVVTGQCKFSGQN